ncbi:MAG TPA: ABC-type transport auxiliary lipoprotein family protein [Candidatus Acidoferrum sp.]|nr:ABC-type transport auxiliary lipoprotein family protein [Candidatus Acidoferrum sp.]
MRRAKYAVLIGLLAGAISGCGGTRPTRYYVISVPATPTGQPSGQFPVSLLVARPITSHLYRDDRIVYGSGPVELGTYEFHRWAQSPADMVQDLLVNYLRSTQQYRSVLRPGTNAKGDYIVRSYLRSLYEVDSPDFVARFAVHIDLYDPKAGATVWSANYSHDEPVSGKSVAAVVEALDKNVRAGMQQLTTELGQYFVEHPPKAEGAQ